MMAERMICNHASLLRDPVKLPVDFQVPINLDWREI
jgi:hypothetical protein